MQNKINIIKVFNRAKGGIKLKHLSKIILTLGLLFLFIGGIIIYEKSKNVDKSKEFPTTIGEIAYDENSQWGYCIYLEEDNELTPFIVLTPNYNGNCLVLRKFLLEDLQPYNSSGEYGAYYNGSYIDNFLNQEYYSRLSESVKKLIVTSKIEITPKKSIDTHTKDTETIMRNIFLLSANEIGYSSGSIALKEGNTLSYFKKVQNRVATYKNLKASPWWLRTPALSNSNTVITIGDDGSIGMGGINTITGISEIAVRPAFCIPSDTHIILSNDVIDGERIFTIQ